LALLASKQWHTTCMRQIASDQQDAIHQMKPQRRQEGVGGKAGGFNRFDASGDDMDRRRRNRRHIGRRERRRLPQISLHRAEKDARAALATVRPVMFAAVGRLFAAPVRMIVAAVVRRGDRRHRVAFLRAGMRVVPTAAQHRMQGQQRRRQIGKEFLFWHSDVEPYYIHPPHGCQRDCRLSPKRLPSMAASAARRSRRASM